MKLSSDASVNRRSELNCVLVSCLWYIPIQMIDMWVHSQRVHPVSECPLFSCLTYTAKDDGI